MSLINTKFLSVFSGKGGVGKSLLTILLADYISSSAGCKTEDGQIRKFKVLLVDFDGQCSCALDIIGEEQIRRMSTQKCSLPDVISELSDYDTLDRVIPGLIAKRKPIADGSRRKKLGEVDVIHSINDFAAINFLGDSNIDEARKIAGNLKGYLQGKYDFVLIDLPGTNTPNYFTLIGMLMAENYVIPTSCSYLETISLGKSFRMLQKIREMKGTEFEHKLLGLVFNMVSKTSSTWKKHKEEILEVATQGGLEKIYRTHFNFNYSFMNASVFKGSSLLDKYATMKSKARALASEILADLKLSKLR